MRTLILSAVILAIFALPGSRARAQQGTARPLVTPAEYLRWHTELSNWGRWGKDDELGTLNLITQAKRKQALALVKEGYPISLSHDELTEKVPDNPNPFVHTMIMPRA